MLGVYLQLNIDFYISSTLFDSNIIFSFNITFLFVNLFFHSILFWVNKTSLTPQLFIEVSAPNGELCKFEFRLCEMYSIQHYIMFVSDLRSIGIFLLKVAFSTIILTLAQVGKVNGHVDVCQGYRFLLSFYVICFNCCDSVGFIFHFITALMLFCIFKFMIACKYLIIWYFNKAYIYIYSQRFAIIG